MNRISRTGILIANLGTPDDPSRSSVNRYLNQFLTDGRVIDYPWLQRQLLVRGLIVPLRAGNSTKLYKRLWTEEGSPLKVFGESVVEQVREELGEDYVVELAMRYQNPSVEDAINRLIAQQVDRIVVFPMFPQYASASTGSLHEEIMRVVSKLQTIPGLVLIRDYYDHPAMIDVIVDHAGSFDLNAYDHILFSYHGVPKRQLMKADLNDHCRATSECCANLTSVNAGCYSAQCYATTRALVARLGLSPDQYTTCFQSRLGKEPWTQPYTSEVLEERAKAGDKRILVFSPAFVADCLETIVEVEFEYQEEFEELGGEKLDLVPSLNDDPAWVKCIVQIIKEHGG